MKNKVFLWLFGYGLEVEDINTLLDKDEMKFSLNLNDRVSVMRFLKRELFSLPNSQEALAELNNDLGQLKFLGYLND